MGLKLGLSSYGNTLRVFGIRMLREILGPKRKEVTGDRRKLDHDDDDDDIDDADVDSLDVCDTDVEYDDDDDDYVMMLLIMMFMFMLLMMMMMMMNVSRISPSCLFRSGLAYETIQCDSWDGRSARRKAQHNA